MTIAYLKALRELSGYMVAQGAPLDAAQKWAEARLRPALSDRARERVAS